MSRADGQKPMFRFSRIRINALGGFSIIGGCATAMHLAGVPEPATTAFVSTAMLVLKDIVKGDQDYYANKRSE